jgi:pimeloyl-ACP methyl ester carboxylesterase
MGNKQLNSESISRDDQVFQVIKPDPQLKRRALEIEKKILKNSCLTLDKDVFIEDIYIDFWSNEENQNYLHTIRCKSTENKQILSEDKNVIEQEILRTNEIFLKEEGNLSTVLKEKENMIIIHGFQGSSITFFKMFHHLCQRYNIYCPDLIGMGLSSRPQVNFTKAEEYIDFFVESLEKFREKLNIKSFHLIGHSFGGYISANYALRYPENISKLTLLSPAGISDLAKGGNISEYMPFGKKVGLTMMVPLWGMKSTVSDLYGNGLLKFIINKSLRKRYDIGKLESELLSQLYEIILEYPKNLDTVLYYIFKPPIPSVKIPLEDRLIKEVKDFKIDFYFGELDWMDQIGSRRVCQSDPERFSLYIISKFGHNFNLENPDELCEVINYNSDPHTFKEKQEKIMKLNKIHFG